MKTSRTCMSVCAVSVCVLVAGLLSGTANAVSIGTVYVGNAGNTGEWSGESYGGYGPDRICGAVSYAYNIGKYEITAGQYTEFLNAVAKTDTYGLYNTYMADTANYWGCNIRRSQNVPYTYTVGNGSQADVTSWANRPVNYVSWGDAARFANWLTNGRKSGSQDSTTTEDGLYYLNGATTNAALLAVTRKPGVVGFAIPTEDEWYKAAYYNPNYGGAGVPGYYDYPTNSNSLPSNDLVEPTDLGNNATYYNGSDSTIGSPYYRPAVGAHENSDSPYGTFDQGGNVWEWNEAVIGSCRGLRGGSFYGSGGLNRGPYLLASSRYDYSPTDEHSSIGFRVSEVPEPYTMLMLALASVGIIRKRRA